MVNLFRSDPLVHIYIWSPLISVDSLQSKQSWYAGTVQNDDLRGALRVYFTPSCPYSYCNVSGISMSYFAPSPTCYECDNYLLLH